jgi:hypothetical protein
VPIEAISWFCRATAQAVRSDFQRDPVKLVED